MRRKLMIAGNWKMNLTVAQSLDLAKGVADGLARDDLEVLVGPHFLALSEVARLLSGSPMKVAAQNLFWEEPGAFTGEICGAMLAALKVSHVILGHSERRQYFQETEKTVSLRLAAATKHGLTPILCIGETLAEREAGQTEGVLESQLAGALAGLSAADLGGLILAYEPVWAIGTGRTASSEQAQQAHENIRMWLTHRFNPDVAQTLRILYGGSVKPGNAAEILAQPDVDGALVGGASLAAADFLGIINAA